MCLVHRLECRLLDWLQHRRLLTKRGIRQPYIYFCTLTVSREDVRAFMAERPEYTKANRFKDIVVKVYI
ncbi:MAG: hypothetical protein HFH30_01285 [Eubacterium sp.]|nr:hypothetical protein [Eubacterium sp.]MCI8918462.1 hypothetical protein [Eubacterium sp.]